MGVVSHTVLWMLICIKRRRIGTYQSVSLLHVSSLQSSNDWSAEVHLLNDVNESLGNSVTPDNSSKDVNKYSRDLGVTGNKLESGFDSCRSSATTDVKEVSRASTVKLDDVHGCHSKTSSVNCRRRS